MICRAVHRIVSCLRAGWAAARERWHQGVDVPAPKRRTSFFDCDTFEAPRTEDDEEAERFYREHFRSGWPRP